MTQEKMPSNDIEEFLSALMTNGKDFSANQNPSRIAEKPEARGKELSPLVTSKEAAEYLRVCLKTLRTTCREQGLEPITIGNKFLYQKADLDRFIENKAEEQRRASGRNLDIPPFKG
ncbi:MAG: helix-turn-helix domain-containing protein [Candidatus Omnitrophica bacterium]|nr:helix-turn-helix domain-containing protein [Candidatus Omnitrophota bacterium]